MFCPRPERSRSHDLDTAATASDDVEVEAELVECPPHGLVDKLGDGPRPVVERRHGRHDGRAVLRRAEQQPQMSFVHRGFPHQQDEFAAFLERDVGRPHGEVVGIAVDDRRERLDAARRDEHAFGAEGAAGHRGAEVVLGVDVVGQRADLGDGVVGLFEDGPPGAPGHHDVGFDVLDLVEQFEGTDAEDRARRPGDRDDEPAGCGHRAAVSRVVIQSATRGRVR
jgi:hypothetical protein